MNSTFGSDLRIARKRAGLTQYDCAHLLGVDQPHISKLESGKAEPSVDQLTLCYLVFGEWSEPIWSGLMGSLAGELRKRLGTLPDCPPGWEKKDERQATLEELIQRLSSVTVEGYDDD